MRGIMRAAPYAIEAPASGELTIDLPHALTYLVTFESDGVAYRLEGKKTPSLLSPIRSMTVMETVLKTATGKELARGQMTFALRELGGFLASWLPFYSGPRVRLDVRRRLLERAELRK